MNLFSDKFSIIDISPAIHEESPVWPGDSTFKRKITASLQEESSVALSTIETTLHIGAHADAPSHFANDSEAIDEVDLYPYIGPCQVIDLSIAKGSRIYPDDIKVEINQPRVLLKSLSFNDPNYFSKDFNSLSKELVDFFYDKKVCLIGIDTPSIDPFNDQKLECHHQILKYKIRNLEGLFLEHVKAGDYFLSALPLKIEGADASPLRAVLLDFYSGASK